MQTILGASGSIGKLLAEELRHYTTRIRLVSRNPKKVNDTDELLPVDLTLPGAVNMAVNGSEVVYLTLGFNYDIKVWEANWPVLMKDTIEACIKHNAKLVFFDNVYTYDKDEIHHMTEVTKVNPSSRKGGVRREINEMLMAAVRDRNLSALIARSADFYGNDSSTTFVAELALKNLAAGKSAQWFMNSGKVHSFTYIPDAARATALLGNTPDAYGQVWHLPTDPARINVTDFIGMIADELNVKPRIRVLPMFMIRAIGLFLPVIREMPEMMYQYDRDYYFDSSKFTKRFGFKPTPYSEGIREMCKGYQVAAQKPAA